MWLSVHEVSQKLNLSIDTIRRWEKKGLIKAERSDKNHRMFNDEEVLLLLNKLNTKADDNFEVLKSKTVLFSMPFEFKILKPTLSIRFWV